MTRKRKQPEPKPIGTLSHPLGGLEPNAEFGPNDREYDPAVGRTGAVPEVPPAPVPVPPSIGTSATITLLSEPNTWLVESDGNSFSFQGDVRAYLANRGVTVIEG